MRRVGFLLCLAVAAAQGLPERGAVGEEDSRPQYEVDFDQLNELWPDLSLADAPADAGWPHRITRIEEAFVVQLQFQGTSVAAPTHLFGPEVVVIPYADDLEAVDALGNSIGRGDQAVSRHFPPGSVGLAVKHHRPSHRRVTLDAASSADEMTEEAKLQDTHVMIIVGIERDGAPGVISINSPQDYQEGALGDPDYPMVFFHLEFPGYVGPNVQQQLIDNIRTMALGFGAVAEFPPNYNGGDPLGAHTPELVRRHVGLMIRALAGDDEARSYFKAPENQIYCAELAHEALTAGLTVPLNDEHAPALLNESLPPDEALAIWTEFCRQIDRHNAGEDSTFWSFNQNPKVSLVRLATPRQLAGLRPMWQYAPPARQREEAAKLAFEPMTLADIIEQFLKTLIDREKLGESVAPVQAAMLERMRPGLFELLALSPDEPKGGEVNALYSEVVSAVAQPYGDYGAFRIAIEPLLAKARQISTPRRATGEGLFVPPSLVHLVAQGSYPGGLLSVAYVGHGVPFEAVRIIQSQ